MCGLNGAGKSTLGKAVAKKLGFYFLDSEELCFDKAENAYDYTSARAQEEVIKRLFSEIRAHENFVFASVKGDYGAALLAFFQYAVLLEVPREVRLQRVYNRSYLEFGDRMLPGGDLYKQENAFFDVVKSRAENTVEKWVQALTCPIMRVDGTKSVEENADFIITQIQNGRRLPGTAIQR